MAWLLQVVYVNHDNALMCDCIRRKTMGRDYLSMPFSETKWPSDAIWGNLVISCSGNFLSPVLHQVSTWTNAYLDIKNNAWVTVNIDFLVTNHLTSNQNIVIHGYECIILFLTCYFISYTPFYYKQSSIAHFAIVATDGLFWFNIVTSSQLFCDVMRMRGTGIVTSYLSIVLARANWRKGDLH